jgi:hypothetical protein
VSGALRGARRRPARPRPRRDDRGVASLELLGMIPLVFVIAAIGLQVGVFLWAVTNTNEAVRQGARAQSLGQDGCAAARATLARSLRSECSGSGGTGMGSPAEVSLVVEVPVLALVDEYLPDVVITRDAYLP